MISPINWKQIHFVRNLNGFNLVLKNIYSHLRIIMLQQPESRRASGLIKLVCSRMLYELPTIVIGYPTNSKLWRFGSTPMDLGGQN